jgi:hypothetical protein
MKPGKKQAQSSAQASNAVLGGVGFIVFGLNPVGVVRFFQFGKSVLAWSIDNGEQMNTDPAGINGNHCPFFNISGQGFQSAKHFVADSVRPQSASPYLYNAWLFAMTDGKN